MMWKVLKKNIGLLIVLFTIGILTRGPLIEKMQSHWDGPQYSIGVVRYSLEQDTPSPPGYPLFIAMGRIIYEFTKDPFKALLFENVFFSGIGTVLFFIAGESIFNKTTAIISALLYLSSPTFYYFGLTAYPYGLVSISALSLALCVYHIVVKKRKLGILLGVLFSIALGIRPQEIIFFAPLFIFGLYNLSRKEKIITLLTSLITALLWMVPFIIIVGGVNKYLEITSSFISQGAISSVSIANFYTYISRILKGYFLTFTISGIFILYYFYRLLGSKSQKVQFYKVIKKMKVQLFIIWIFPSLLINLLLRSDHAGYQMTYLSSLVILVAYSIDSAFKKRAKLLYPCIVISVIFNLFWFFKDRDPKNNLPYTPTSFHYSEIRKNDIRMLAKINYIKNNFKPSNTLIITTSELWRPYMYYLKDFNLYEFDGLTTNDINFKDIRRSSNYWVTLTQRAGNNKFTIDVAKFKDIILIDNEEEVNVISASKKIINLADNSKIIVINNPNKLYTFSFKKLEEVR